MRRDTKENGERFQRLSADGDTVVGGGAEPEAGAKVVSGEEGVARGGFGHAGGGEGGGEGGHGGGGEGGGE
jgi:hypothetical protein